MYETRKSCGYNCTWITYSSPFEEARQLEGKAMIFSFILRVDHPLSLGCLHPYETEGGKDYRLDASIKSQFKSMRQGCFLSPESAREIDRLDDASEIEQCSRTTVFLSLMPI